MKGGTAMKPMVSVTGHDGKRLVECDECGPVAVTDLPAWDAAREHLGRVHGTPLAKRAEQ
jgi:hypothetical protein